ncbi:MAG TPA: hypothetical protein DEF34_13115 [Desulfotomaculum sp.]|nr:MAG: hypothetical protein VR67_01720 [Peptococcaceae bacterium BRH_c8a]KJS71995.1 MAG: hypothetical protein JL56_13765 [Desulfotomaculum sp. BICA1-6]HBX24552.1 hypothetical protein [Desulfotomaculum sp.]
MFNDKTEPNKLASNGKCVNGNRTENNIDAMVALPRPRTPSELLLCITNYVNMLNDIKGLNTISKETLYAADEMLTRGQGLIRKLISEIKRKEEGQLQLHFSVRNAFYGVTKAFGDDNDVVLTKAKDVAISVGKQLNLPDIEKYVHSLELEYKSGVKRYATGADTGKETTAKYRIVIDGKTVSEKCRRNNMELARILYKQGVTEGVRSDDCKALGIDITAINNLNDPVEFRIKRKHIKIERIK